MGDKVGADSFLVFAVIMLVGAFWAAWKGWHGMEAACVFLGVVAALCSVALFTWGLG